MKDSARGEVVEPSALCVSSVVNTLSFRCGIAPLCAPSKIGSSPCRYSILLQCHSEERSDEESAYSRFRGVKNIKQILHFVQDDNLVK
jgi:hypothetical protein